MKLKDVLRNELDTAIHKGDGSVKDAIRLILSELDRISKDPLDEDIIKTLKKLKKLELEALSYSSEDTSVLLTVINAYLPKEVTADDIEKWIKDNLNLSLFKNKMQAVGVVLKHFGQGANGQVVKDIIINRF